MERTTISMNKKITPGIVISTYKYLLDTTGKSSCGSCSDQLDHMGYVSPRGKKISRMSVWRMLTTYTDGRDLLKKTKQRMGRLDDR